MGPKPRQTFQGHDDLLLLARIAQAPPWRHRSGVMDAWQHIAQALNGDAGCSLSSVTAAASRARFFRLVAQRRARQEAMLRRACTDECQYQQKMQALDALIASMDALDEDSSLQRLLNEEDEDEEWTTIEPTLSVPRASLTATSTMAPLQRVPTPLHPPPAQHVQQQVGNQLTAAARQPMATQQKPAASYRTQHAVTTNLQTIPARPPMTYTRAATVIPAESPELNRSGSARTGSDEVEPPTKKKKTSGTTSVAALSSTNGGERWDRIADRALEFFQRKIELDQEAAEADRAWRREEARARQKEMRTMREQTDRLILAVIELAKSK